MSDLATTTKPIISQLSELISATAGLAWPAIVCVVLFLARDLGALLTTAIEKFKASSEFKIGSIEIKGVAINARGEVIKGGEAGFELINATKADAAARRETYVRQRNLMLVHRN
jgi:hypothetical protein